MLSFQLRSVRLDSTIY